MNEDKDNDATDPALISSYTRSEALTEAFLKYAEKPADEALVAIGDKIDVADLRVRAEAARGGPVPYAASLRGRRAGVPF